MATCDGQVSQQNVAGSKIRKIFDSKQNLTIGCDESYHKQSVENWGLDRDDSCTIKTRLFNVSDSTIGEKLFVGILNPLTAAVLRGGTELFSSSQP